MCCTVSSNMFGVIRDFFENSKISNTMIGTPYITKFSTYQFVYFWFTWFSQPDPSEVGWESARCRFYHLLYLLSKLCIIIMTGNIFLSVFLNDRKLVYITNKHMTSSRQVHWKMVILLHKPKSFFWSNVAFCMGT